MSSPKGEEESKLSFDEQEKKQSATEEESKEKEGFGEGWAGEAGTQEVEPSSQKVDLSEKKSDQKSVHEPDEFDDFEEAPPSSQMQNQPEQQESPKEQETISKEVEKEHQNDQEIVEDQKDPFNRQEDNNSNQEEEGEGWAWGFEQNPDKEQVEEKEGSGEEEKEKEGFGEGWAGEAGTQEVEPSSQKVDLSEKKSDQKSVHEPDEFDDFEEASPQWTSEPITNYQATNQDGQTALNVDKTNQLIHGAFSKKYKINNTNAQYKDLLKEYAKQIKYQNPKLSDSFSIQSNQFRKQQNYSQDAQITKQASSVLQQLSQLTIQTTYDISLSDPNTKRFHAHNQLQEQFPIGLLYMKEENDNEDGPFSQNYNNELLEQAQDNMGEDSDNIEKQKQKQDGEKMATKQNTENDDYVKTTFAKFGLNINMLLGEKEEIGAGPQEKRMKPKIQKVLDAIPNYNAYLFAA